MSRLLTEDLNKFVAKEYSRRRLNLSLVGVVVALLVGLVGLLPSYVLSKARHSEVLLSLDTVNEETDSELAKWVGQTRAMLALYNPTEDADKPYEAIKLILAELVPGVKLNSINWRKVEAGTELAVTGTAITRQALISFERGVEESGKFSEVVLPLSNLAKDKDLNFELKAVLKK